MSPLDDDQRSPPDWTEAGQVQATNQQPAFRIVSYGSYSLLTVANRSSPPLLDGTMLPVYMTGRIPISQRKVMGTG